MWLAGAPTVANVLVAGPLVAAGFGGPQARISSTSAVKLKFKF